MNDLLQAILVTQKIATNQSDKCLITNDINSGYDIINSKPDNMNMADWENEVIVSQKMAIASALNILMDSQIDKERKTQLFQMLQVSQSSAPWLLFLHISQFVIKRALDHFDLEKYRRINLTSPRFKGSYN